MFTFIDCVIFFFLPQWKSTLRPITMEFIKQWKTSQPWTLPTAPPWKIEILSFKENESFSPLFFRSDDSTLGNYFLNSGGRESQFEQLCQSPAPIPICSL